MSHSAQAHEPTDRPQPGQQQYRLSLRARLSLLYGVAFFLAGSILVGVNYGLVRHSLDAHKVDLVVVQGADSNPDEIAIPTRQLAHKLAVQEAAERDAALREQLRDSIFALVIVGVLAGALGYAAATHALRPVNRITGAARRVAAGNLHERIGLAGPDDEIKELADTFDHMVSRVQAAFSSQQRFVANASHELRTPLATNRTVLEVAMSAPDASDDLKETGIKLLRVTERNEQLIDGLLTLARSEHELGEHRPVELASVAAQAVGATNDDFARGNVTVSRQLEPAPLVGSPILIERLIINLLQNAARYNRAEGWAHIRTGTHQGWSIVEVANTGKEVNPNMVDQLFEPFHRGESQRTERRGAGLGLSIVRAVAHTHGGGATAWPNPGGGLVVRAWFPLVRSSDPTSRSELPVSPPSGQQRS